MPDPAQLVSTLFLHPCRYCLVLYEVGGLLHQTRFVRLVFPIVVATIFLLIAAISL